MKAWQLAGLAVLAVVIVSVFHNRSGEDFGSQRSSRSAETADEGDVNIATYSQVRSGMTYAEVARLAGRQGVEISSSDVAGIRSVMYSWNNNDGSGMNAIFQNGKLVQKAQFGLK